MKKSKSKKSFSSYIKKLNEIDINVLIESLKNINLKDLKEVDFKELVDKIRKSPILMPTLGLISASVFFSILLIPSFNQVLTTFKKANDYRNESNEIEFNRNKIIKLEKKINESVLAMSELNKSIINKSDVIFISKLINETAIKSDVEITSILPIQSAKSDRLCRISNQSPVTRKRNKKTSPKKSSFQSNLFEINLNSNYLSVIEFLRNIQYYNVLIVPNCLEVKPSDVNSNKGIKLNDPSNSSRITTLSVSGKPMKLTNNKDQLDEINDFKKVKTRLVIRIPSHWKE